MFDCVEGHSFPKEILTTAIRTGAISHGYIFYGQQGVGKTTLALEFAKSIVCHQKNACGSCAACKQFQSTSDIRVIDCEKSISVDDIRAITTEIFLRPFLFEKKIYIIRDAHKMTVGAQNALLKVFEEPPEYAVIILVTSNISLLLPTILSRGVQIRFQPLSPAEIRACFRRHGAEEPPPEIISQANGSYTRAVELFSSEDYRQMREKVLRDFSLLLKNKTKKDVIRLYSDFLTYEEQAASLIDILNSAVYDGTVTEKTLQKNPDAKDCVSLSLQTASEIYAELSELSARLSSNAAYPVTVLSALIRIQKRIAEG